MLSTALVSVECWPAAGQPSVGPARPQCGDRSSAVQRNNDRVRLRRDGERSAATTRSVLPHKHSPHRCLFVVLYSEAAEAVADNEDGNGDSEKCGRDRSEKVGSTGMLNRHSLSSLRRRKQFPRKPSSWRHPGGTVSETEETDFSECETDSATERADRRKPNYVHSFTFSSLSRFRIRHNSGQSDLTGKHGSKSPSCLSQLSIEGRTEEEKLVLGNSAGQDSSKQDWIELAQQIASPARSPNRKLKEATDKVGDKLRALSQKFKENREKDKGKTELSNARSSSAGRSETIEEETFEDVEAERAGVIRAYSLNSKLITKPLLQSHSSTESNDIPTPRGTPGKAKKKLLLKKTRTVETEYHGQSHSGSQKRKSHLILKSSQQKPTTDWSPDSSCSERLDCSTTADLPSDDCSDSFSPVDCLSRDFPFTFPEVFRQAIEEVDNLANLTQKCVKEAEILPNEAESDLDSEQENMTGGDSGCSELNSETGQLCANQTGKSQQKTREKAASVKLEEKSTKQSKLCSPIHSINDCTGHRSRPGSKRRRKKDSSKNNSNSELKISIQGCNPQRSASYSALESDIETECRALRTCMSSSPSPGSSTLPRSSSGTRRPAELPVCRTSVLSLQLEGAFPQSLCVESVDREDTTSPSTSHRTGHSVLQSRQNYRPLP